MKELQKEYWQKRCELAEAVLKESHILLTDTVKNYPSTKDYLSYLESADATALYTGFQTLIGWNGMKYEFTDKNNNGMFLLKFNYLDHDYDTGYHVTATSLYRLFQNGVNILQNIQ